MRIEGIGSQAIRDHEAEIAKRLTFTSAKQALDALATIDMVERGSDALGYNAIAWHARVRHAAYDWLREHPVAAGCERATRLEMAMAEAKRAAERAPNEIERRANYEAAADYADQLSAQWAELGRLTVRDAA